ncbi:hypothetical protein [Nonomuraea recticatena]|uniref:hypothetical protein n=1 Tax=Nonomuraea recticatena TaxID=46178 RepID=UPI00361222AB
MTGSADSGVLVSVPPGLREQFFPDPSGLLALGRVRLLDDHAGLADALPGTGVLVTSWGVPRSPPICSTWRPGCAWSRTPARPSSRS